MKCWRDREQFKARVLEWAAKLDVKAHSIYVRPMRHKWASCSTAGTLSFNDELLGLDTKLGDYVIVHVGYALNKLDPEEAAKTLKLFAEMGELAFADENPTLH